MAFTDFNPGRLKPGLAVCALAVLLSGCTALNERLDDLRSARATRSETVKAEQTPADMEEAPLILIPDPYEAQTVEIPAAAQRLFQEAVIAMQSDDYTSAQRLLTQIVQEYPKLSGPYVNLGITLWRLGHLDKAQEAFAFAVKVNPKNSDAYNQHAILLREQGRFAEAEKLYLAALDVWPHSPHSHRNLGILYDLYMGKWDKALEHYQMVKRILPEPSQEIEGWIIDLQRRIDEAAAG